MKRRLAQLAAIGAALAATSVLFSGSAFAFDPGIYGEDIWVPATRALGMWIRARWGPE